LKPTKNIDMTLHTLLENTNWLSVWDRFAKLYPSQFDNEQFYYKAYSKLKQSTPIKNTTKLVIDEKISQLNYVKWVSVLGVLLNNEIDYALEFNTWEEWLGMEVDTITLAEFSKNDIIAHCLFEMAYEGNSKSGNTLRRHKVLEVAS
jgi:hypothetical protein